ncbi:TetR/AcrR family transcriptional regulator [Blastococcus haudaquaticus]|uniref:Transcriptional regulator, TetR family n=1 Tax=Blastococcus haudaquaticus TaxID=1938745 RepID=A0A286GXU8_9ACTN|nr:TetR/AcrR family transcriptional regulator [Blastococcus haudaquaticus]SOE00312.1 transcriptional regulator, TetR family [Blastococcus haudaquaticus]
MSEIQDRRAAKKAHTRRHIRDVAQRMFADGGFDAVTIADIAREADVAVQTVFNHFVTKEDLFFDGRLPWVEAPAEAVRGRPPGTSPLTALRRHLVEGAGHFGTLHLSAEGRSFTAALAACPALAAHEQRVIQEAERRLSAALAEAWLTDPEPGAPHLSSSAIVAPLTAAIWLAASRVVFVEHRRQDTVHGDVPDRVAALEQLIDRVLAGIQSQIGSVTGAGDGSETGWPPAAIRRAG